MAEDKVMEAEKEAPVEGGKNAPIEMDFEEEGEAERGAWGSQLEFVLTCVGYAVGLGNVWRFPYLCFKNGGGAFLVPYFLMLFLCGMPMFFFEICFGQFASLGPISIWSISPLFKGVGMSMVMVTFFVGLTYNILNSYILYFLFASFTSKVPWKDCDNLWNSYKCMTADHVRNSSYKDWYLEEHNMTAADIKSPSEEYFYGQVLQISPGIDEMGGLVWQLALCLLITWMIVYIVLIKGISSLGKVVYFTSTFPYVMMTIMVVRGVTLEGAWQGIEFYLKPDFSRLSDAVVWSDAASQIFYSLSTCTGGLLAMSSYNNFNHNTYRDAFMVPIINCCTSVFAGFSIFSVLGYMANLKGVSVEEVAASGPGLIFVVYPEGLANMPVAPLWSGLFFFMMLTLGFSSQFSIVECAFVAVMDQFPALRATPIRPMLFRGAVISIYFLISLPMVCQGGFYIFNIVDSYAGAFPRLFTGIFELIVVNWIYGLDRFSEDICMMIGRKPNLYFRACWKCISLCLIISIILFKFIQQEPLTLGAYTYPGWADTLGWLMVCSVLVWIPVWWVVQFLLDGGWTLLKKMSAPRPEWGPANVENRTGRYKPLVQQYISSTSEQPNTIYNELNRRSSLTPSESSLVFTTKSNGMTMYF